MVIARNRPGIIRNFFSFLKHGASYFDDLPDGGYYEKRYIIRITASLLLLLLLAGCSKPASESAGGADKSEPVSVETAVCNVGTIAIKKEISGKITAEEDIPVIPSMPSKVLEILVKQGDKVNTGDLLFITDSKDINNQYVPAKNAYDRTSAVTEDALKLTRQNLENTKKLYAAGAVPKIQVDQEELALKQQEAQLLTQLDQLKAALDTARDALSDTSMLSPASGVISSLSIVQGATAPTGQPALYVSRVGTVSAEINVSENILPLIKVGQEVTVTLSASLDKIYSAKIESIAPTANKLTQLYLVEVTLDNSAGVFIPGMFVNVAFNGETRENTVLVPAEAILTDGNKKLVFVVENNKTKRVEVTTGLSDGKTTELLSGLKGGETVIIKGQDYVDDGGDVKIVGGGAIK